MGWGRTVPERDVAGRRLERLNSLVTDRLNGTAARLDIWEVEIEVEPDGFVRKAGAKKPHADDGGCQSFLKTKMSNYFSLGLQGMIGSYFEARRTSSRIGNILVYARASFHYLVRGFPHVIDSLRSIDVGGVPVIHIGKEEQEQARRQSSGRNLGTPAAPSGPPLLRQNGVELIVANIPGLWGRQVDLWSTARNKQSVVENASGPTDYRNWNPNSAQDGKLEMFIIRNVGEYMLKQVSLQLLIIAFNVVVDRFPGPIASHR